MVYLIILMAALYIFGVHYVACRAVLVSLQRVARSIEIQKKVNKGLQKRHAELCYSKERDEREMNQIFTLYDLTKELTRNFSENDAYQTFIRMLKKNLNFKSSHLVPELTAEIKNDQRSGKCFCYSLNDKNRLLGYLVIKGLPDSQREKFIVLAHQFALAFRRIRLYKDIETLAITDSLTEAHTRRYILGRFEEEIKRASSKRIKLSFLMIDVDYFKKMNDRLGHLPGDRILRKITDILRDNIREIDILGRYGGEEFCVVLPDTEQSGAHFVAERIRVAVENTPIQAYDTVIHATISIGLATFPDHGSGSAEILEKADKALYCAKTSGRNKVCIS